jgi:hypothetical protein
MDMNEEDKNRARGRQYKKCLMINEKCVLRMEGERKRKKERSEK